MMMDFTVYTQLPTVQQLVLCYVAYADTIPEGRTMDMLCQAGGVQGFQLMEAMRLLTGQGMLRYDQGSGRRVGVHHRLRALCFLYCAHPEWVGLFSRLCQYLRLDAGTLRVAEFAQSFCAGLQTELHAEYQPGLDPLFCLSFPLITEESMQCLVAQMPNSTFLAFIRQLWPWLLAHDVQAASAIPQLWQGRDLLDTKLYDEWQNCQLYLYYATGQVSGADLSGWQQQVVRAVQAHVGGNDAQARSEFALALSGSGMGGRKVPFLDYLSNYFYILTLSTDPCPDTRIRLSQMSQSYKVERSVSSLLILLHSTYYRDAIHRVDDLSLRTLTALAQEHDAMGYSCMAYLCCSRFKRYCDINLPAMGYQPRLWILRQLLSPILAARHEQPRPAVSPKVKSAVSPSTNPSPVTPSRTSVAYADRSIVVRVSEQKKGGRLSGYQIRLVVGRYAPVALARQLLAYIRSLGCIASIVTPYIATTDATTQQMLQLMEYLHEHAEAYTLEWKTDNPLKLRELSGHNVRLNLRQREGWLELEGDVQLDDGHLVTVREFFGSILTQSQQGFLQVGEGNYLRLSDRLRSQLQQLASGFHDNGHRLVARELSAAQMADAMQGEVEVAGRNVLDDICQRMADVYGREYAVPDSLHATLRPYQYQGFVWMNQLADIGAGACLADDMGLGKTLQSISFLLSRAHQGPSLVFAPASVVKNWEAEIRRFAPTLRPIVLNAGRQRQRILTEASAGDVVITTYGLLVSMSQALAARQWCVICLDEAHTIKNKTTQTSDAAMALQSRYRLALTGTPIQNNLSELWNIFQFLNPGLLGGYESFSRKFVGPIMNNQDLDRQEQLKSLIAPFMLRRTKAEVVHELPAKSEQTILVRLADGEMEAYEHLRQQIQAETKAARQQKGNRVEILSQITRLRLAACATRLISREWSGPSSKIAAFRDTLAQIRQQPDSRVLVFSQFTSFLAMVGEWLQSQGLEYLYLDGSVPIRERSKLVDRFQQGDCPIFLISLQAGGLGLNLTQANHVILMDPWWNPAIEQQAIDRAYRIGQQRDVQVYHLISANTIEEKIVRLQQTKRDMATALLTGEEMTRGITYDELVALVDDHTPH